MLLNAATLCGDTPVPLDSDWRWQKGLSEASVPDPTAWRQLGFDDGSWSSGLAPFWYGDAQPAPGIELADMMGGYTGIFLRRTFVVNYPADVSSLIQGAQSDDGFIGWINGREVARFNMPVGG
jgi:hypothetical protein